MRFARRLRRYAMPRSSKKEAGAQVVAENRSALDMMAYGPVLSRVAFMHKFNNLLRGIEKAAPHKNARELEHRIADGTAKIARARGKAAEADIARAEETLAGLKAELVALHREYIVPHHVMHMLHYLLDLHDRQPWPLKASGSLAVNLPGVISIAVEVSAEPPF
jgi:hypothetical protein